MDKGLTNTFDRSAFLSDIVLQQSVEAAIKRHRQDWGRCKLYSPKWREATGCVAKSAKELWAEAMAFEAGRVQ